MGTADTTEKILEAYNDVFADILNALLFNGNKIVNADELVDAQPFSAYKMDDSIKWQERDVSKYWTKKKTRISCFGFENQTKIDYAMPIRAMNYDAAEYFKQIGSKNPYYPVITIVLHFGTKQKWTGKKSILDLLGESIDSEILPFVNDYKIKVFDLAWLSTEEISHFKSDFKLVVEYLRAERTGKIENWDKMKLKHIHEVLNLLKSISHNDVFAKMEDFIEQTQRETGGIQMSEFVQSWINKGRDEGFSLGRSEGISLGRSEGFSLGRSEGFSLGRNEGISIGRNEGITIATNRMTSLMARLYAEGRDADVKRAMTDSAYLQELLSTCEQ